MSDLGWVTSTVMDLRREPDARSERVSQLIVFTTVEILEAKQDWLLVRGPDGYIGWAKEAQISLGSLPQPCWKVRVPWAFIRDVRNRAFLGILPFDARFVGEEKGKKVVLRWGKDCIGYIEKKALEPVTWKGSIKELRRIAQKLVGVPYLWGGTTPFGFDCSGLVQRLFHFIFNIWLPRDSHEQQEAGEKILNLSKLRVGDVLCFPGHVAIFVGKGKIIHASGRFGQVVTTNLLGDDPYGRELHDKLLFGVRVRCEDRLNP